MAIRELDTVVLTRDVPEHGLLAGDLGVVVHAHSATAFEVEFVTADGRTVALLTLTASDVRPRGTNEILRVRDFAGPIPA
jgi:hypothetical protein